MNEWDDVLNGAIVDALNNPRFQKRAIIWRWILKKQ